MRGDQQQVSVSRVVPAPPEAIFDVLADPAQHPLIDGSGTVRRAWASNPDRLDLGAKFGMAMRIGVPYPIRNTVVEFEENRCIAWRHVGRHRWRWELEPVEGGTRVTHTFDWAPALSRTYVEAFKWPERNLAGMEQTLEHLTRLVTTGVQPKP